MTTQEIFKKVIEKAVKNGFNNGMSSTYTQEEIIEFLTKDYEPPDVNTIIFNLHFAKAFWGDEEAKIEHQGWVQEYTGKPAWQYHLQQMVISENPLKYLGQYL